MTREETKQLFKKIMVVYPSFKPGDLSEALDIWSKSLQNDSYSDVLEKFDNYIVSNRFAPTIADLKVKKKTFSNFTERNYSKEFWNELERMANQ